MGDELNTGAPVRRRALAGWQVGKVGTRHLGGIAMSTETTGFVTMSVERVGDQVVIHFDSGETLILSRHDALNFAASVSHVATCGVDSLDHIHEEVAP